MADDTFVDLETELKHIKWDILELSEVWKRDLLHYNRESSDRGVGFMENRTRNIVIIESIGDRVIYLIDKVNK